MKYELVKSGSFNNLSRKHQFSQFTPRHRADSAIGTRFSTKTDRSHGTPSPEGRDERARLTRDTGKEGHAHAQT